MCTRCPVGKLLLDFRCLSVVFFYLRRRGFPAANSLGMSLCVHVRGCACTCVRARVHICRGQRSALSAILKTYWFWNTVILWLSDWDKLIGHWVPGICLSPPLPPSTGVTSEHRSVFLFHRDAGDQSQVQVLVRKTLDQALFVFCNIPSQGCTYTAKHFLLRLLLTFQKSSAQKRSIKDLLSTHTGTLDMPLV